MILIHHRRNTIAELNQSSPEYGIEVDIRSKGNQLIIHHDAFTEGEDFEQWLSHYQHKTLILNVKEEGLENRLLELMDQYRIIDFFFLDQSFPFLIKTARAGESRCAVRFSEYESLETVLNLQGLVDWVWVDCFTKIPLTNSIASQLQAAGFKLCLVSGELQGREAKQDIFNTRLFLAENQLKLDAVCTKFPELWQ